MPHLLPVLRVKDTAAAHVRLLLGDPDRLINSASPILRLRIDHGLQQDSEPYLC